MDDGLFGSAIVMAIIVASAVVLKGCPAHAGLSDLDAAYKAKQPKIIEKIVTKQSPPKEVIKTIQVPGKTITKTVERVVEKPVYIDRPYVVEKQVLVPQNQIDIHLEPGEAVAVSNGVTRKLGKEAARQYMDWKTQDDALAALEIDRMKSELALQKKIEEIFK